MTMRPVCLDVEDAVELGEVLEFIGDWLAWDHWRLGESVSRFLGVEGYDVEQLRTDLSRFAFLLGNDGELLFGGEDR
ncbi:MAG: hypothetical protein NVS3B12_07380 [Acidimicrobiales bacterium]